MVSPETYSERQIAQLLGTDLSSSSSSKEVALLLSAEFSNCVELLVWLLLDPTDSKEIA